MNKNKDISDKKYAHYNDYNFRSILQKRANGLLEFAGIPYKIKKTIISEITNLGPNIHRIDFAAEVQADEEEICLIVECQTNIPTEDDIKRFFQYVSSLRIFKNCKIELYILCTEKASYDRKDFIIKDGCTYTMHFISFKNFKASEIFKSIEDKLKNKDVFTDEDIAALQVIVYTDFQESKLEVLNKARKLIEKVAEVSEMDINEKTAIIYLLDVLSTNMLNDEEFNKYLEENEMILNPVERYYTNKGRQEGMREGMREGKKESKESIAGKMLEKGFSIDVISEITGLTKNDILNGK